MWIQISGAAGTGKNVILDNLLKDGFELIEGRFKNPLPESLCKETGFTKELKYSMHRLNAQLKASDLMNRRDVVTMRSFWESNEIFIPIALEQHLIDEGARDILKTIYQVWDDAILEPPHAVIFTETEKMSAFDRMALRGVDINQEAFNAQLKAYRAFIERVKVPVIELDATRDPGSVRKEMDFGIASLKAGNLNSQTVWQRSFFR